MSSTARLARLRRLDSWPPKKVSPYTISPFSLSAHKALRHTVNPIVADVKDTSAYLSLVSTLDVIIEAIGGPEAKELSDIVFSATVQAVQELRPAHAPKLTYIYTSGTWVHGDDRTEVVTDSTPLTSPAELVAWRPAMEQRIITNPHLNGIVIRPSLLYGRSGSLLAPLFKSAYEGEVAWFGTPGGRLALVHCDDLAEAYLLVAEKAAIAGGKIFDASNDVNESTDAVLQRLVEISGAKGYKYIEPSNCECSDCLFDVIRC